MDGKLPVTSSAISFRNRRSILQDVKGLFGFVVQTAPKRRFGVYEAKHLFEVNNIRGDAAHLFAEADTSAPKNPAATYILVGHRF
jgi:hypothetical protein